MEFKKKDFLNLLLAFSTSVLAAKCSLNLASTMAARYDAAQGSGQSRSIERVRVEGAQRLGDDCAQAFQEWVAASKADEAKILRSLVRSGDGAPASLGENAVQLDSPWAQTAVLYWLGQSIAGQSEESEDQDAVSRGQDLPSSRHSDLAAKFAVHLAGMGEPRLWDDIVRLSLEDRLDLYASVLVSAEAPEVQRELLEKMESHLTDTGEREALRSQVFSERAGMDRVLRWMASATLREAFLQLFGFRLIDPGEPGALELNLHAQFLRSDLTGTRPTDYIDESTDGARRRKTIITTWVERYPLDLLANGDLGWLRSLDNTIVREPLGTDREFAADALLGWIGGFDAEAAIRLHERLRNEYDVVGDLYQTLRILIDHDVEAASSWLAQIPNGARKDDLIGSLIQAAALDGELRVQWASQMSDAAKRARYIKED